MTPNNSPGTALVTGGAVRLGKAIAIALAAAGYDIALHYNSSVAPAAVTAKEIRTLGVRCELFQYDLSDAGEFRPFIKSIQSQFPAFNVLANSASGYTQATIADSTIDDFDKQFAVNLRAPFFLSQAFAATVEYGNIINIIDNKIGFHQFKYAAYLLSKKALAEFTHMAALEFAPRIRVNGVAPGVVMPMSSRSEEYIKWRISAIPVGQQGSAKNITSAMLHLLENDFINGQIITVDGGENILHTGQNAGDFDQTKV